MPPTSCSLSDCAIWVIMTILVIAGPLFLWAITLRRALDRLTADLQQLATQRPKESKSLAEKPEKGKKSQAGAAGLQGNDDYGWPCRDPWRDPWRDSRRDPWRDSRRDWDGRRRMARKTKASGPEGRD